MKALKLTQNTYIKEILVHMTRSLKVDTNPNVFTKNTIIIN